MFAKSLGEVRSAGLLVLTLALFLKSSTPHLALQGLRLKIQFRSIRWSDTISRVYQRIV
jgi:hypothetical protein